MPENAYRHSSPAPSQVKFPPKRRLARMRSAVSSGRGKRQSTSTQLDYVSSSNGSNYGISALSDNSEFEESRPTKRRKKSTRSSKEAIQSTLTQNWNQLDETRIVYETDDEVRSIFSDDQLGNVADIDLGRDEEAQLSRVTKANDTTTDLREDTRSSLKASSKAKLNTHPTTADSSTQPSTPRKENTAEIPSSETPASIKLSGNRFERQTLYSVSPLKQKNPNIQLLRQPHRTSFDPPKSLDFYTQDDLDVTSVVHLTQPAESHTNHQLREPARNVLPTQKLCFEEKKLERVNTIPDSQSDLTLESLEAGTDDETNNPSTLEEAYDFEHRQPFQQCTYDPVTAALELDAGRYGRTQTQGSRPHHRRNNFLIDDDEEEEDPDELEETLATFEQNDISTRIRDFYEPEDENEQHLSTFTPDKRTEKESNTPSKRSRPSSVTAKSTNTPRTTIMHTQPISSSIPHLRPSQISTVVSSPVSTTYPNQAHDLDLCSLQMGACGWPETLSSSPFPAPPWSISDSTYPRAEAGKTQADSLADFSLPSPPPMSSSRNRR